jgi:ubiquinone/menaquinone biosynthesis C-methylase UbiE
MSRQKNWTGERLETFITGETMTEHLHRYAIAMDLVKEKTVLDIACGEGYGANLLAQYAAHVTGIDIDIRTVTKAKSKYVKKNLSFLAGCVENIPSPDSHFDIVVSFETIEHTYDHEKMLQEIKRVLKPDGLLIISTPDKTNYSDITNYKNPFHKKELYENQFVELLKKYFSFTSFYVQSSFLGSFIGRKNDAMIEKIYTGDYTAISKDMLPPVLYHIAFASEKKISQAATSFFQNPQILNNLLEEQKSAVKKTITYRTGNMILFPFKFIRSLFRK